MSSPEYRQSERILLTLPILVTGFDPSGADFVEETRTVVVNRDGALIALKHELAPENTIRIFNLQNDAAGNFRVVGPTRMATEEGTEWGVEYLKAGMNIWGIDFPRQPPESEMDACALLECQTCQKKFFWPLTLMEIEVLTSTGAIQNFCDGCGEPAKWTFADVNLRPDQRTFPRLINKPSESFTEQRESNRLLMKLPIFVRNQNGEAETSKTENVSPGSLAVALAMALTVGDLITVICPFSSTGRNLERKGRVLRREPFALGSKRLYAMRYVLPTPGFG